MPLIALVDCFASGHHGMYARAYRDALLGLGCEVVVVGPESLHREVHADGVGGGKASRVVWDPAGMRRSACASPELEAEELWRSLGQALDIHDRETGLYPDLILHLYLDVFLTELLPPDVLEHVRCSVAGLWFKPPRPMAWRVKEWVKRASRLGRRYRLLRAPALAGLLVLDPVAVQGIPRPRPVTISVPELTTAALPVETPPIVHRIRDAAANRRIYSLVGSLDRRKGVGAFLSAARHAATREWFFVLAGRVAWETLGQAEREELGRIAQHGSRDVILIDQWVEDTTLNAIIAESHLLHACYEDWPYSSNMLCKAAAFGVPVLCCDQGYLGRNSREYGLGKMVPTVKSIEGLFVPGFAEVVSQIAASDEFQAGAARYLKRNRPEVLGAALQPLVARIAACS